MSIIRLSEVILIAKGLYFSQKKPSYKTCSGKLSIILNQEFQNTNKTPLKWTSSKVVRIFEVEYLR